MTHGEGLARQNAVGHDGLEELLLAHRGKQEAHVALLGAELAGDLIAVDVVDLTAELLEVLVDEGLQCADGQLDLRVGDGDEIVVAVPADLDDVALALALVGVGVELLELFHELLMVDAEEHAVDGLELERIVVVVHDLDKCVAGGQREVFLGSLALLLLFIAGLGGGEGVVAVADGEQQGRDAGDAVLALHCLVGREAGQRVGDCVDLRSGELVALDMAAVFHQVEVIDALHLVGHGGQGLDDGLLGVINEQHDVGQLDGGVAAHAGARGDTVEHGALSRADQRAGAGGEVVLVEVDHTNEAVTDLTVALAALDVDEGVLERLEDALFEVLAHRGVDVGDELVDVGGLQVGLGQDEAQGGRRVADGLLHALPVLGLRGELVACDDRPLAHIDILLGQQNVGRIKAKFGKLFVHGDSSVICLISGTRGAPLVRL